MNIVLGQCCLLSFPLAFLLASAAGEAIRVTPKPTTELLPNPGMGWQTFHCFADEDKNLQGLPSASAYFRFYWREIEPNPGQVDFAKFDELLAHARRAGQKLAFRVMCTGSGEYMDCPKWLQDQGCAGVEFSSGGRKHWVPDFADSLFQQAHFSLIRELGRRYDTHPDLDLVDIGSVGLWGEWHMSGTTRVDNGRPVEMPPVAVRLAIIDEWCHAFPRTPKVILIGSEEGMSQAQAKGCGWRADCLGDMGGFSKTWNHMDNFYLQQLERTRAQEAWRTGPVAFESCWDMRKWKESGWDIQHIFDYGLRCHASYMNNKSAPIPEGTRGEVESFLRRLGYRFVICSMEHDRTAQAGSVLRVMVEAENVGVAPPYRDYFPAVRLRSVDARDSEAVLQVSKDSLRGWLPGARKWEFGVQLPNQLHPGDYELAVGVMDLEKKPVIRLAIGGRSDDGWYPLSRIRVAR